MHGQFWIHVLAVMQGKHEPVKQQRDQLHQRLGAWDAASSKTRATGVSFVLNSRQAVLCSAASGSGSTASSRIHSEKWRSAASASLSEA